MADPQAAQPQQNSYEDIATPVAASATPAPTSTTANAGAYDDIAKPIPEGFLHSVYSNSVLPAVSYAFQHPIQAAKNVSEFLGPAFNPSTGIDPNNPINKMVIDQVHSTAQHLKQAGKDITNPESWKQENVTGDIGGRLTGLPLNVRRDVAGAIPVLGPTVEKAQSQYEQGDLPGAFGTLAAPVIQAPLDEATGAVVRGGIRMARAARGLPMDAAHAITNTTTGAVKDLVRETETSNADIQAATDKANADAKAAHEASLDIINAKNDQLRAQAIERSKQLHDQAANSIQAVNDVKAAQHSEKVQGIVQQNQAAEEATAKTNDEALQQAQTQHAQDVQDAADTETKRGTLARKAIELKNRLAQHVQEFEPSVRSGLNQRFDAVRKAVDEAGVGEADAAPLSGVAEAETKRLGETGDRVNQFKAIVDRAQGEAATEEDKDALSQKTFGHNYEELPSNQTKVIDEAIAQRAAEKAEATGGEGEEEQPSTFTYGQLRRISSKLGSQAWKLNGVDDYLASSIKNVKNTVDAMAHQMARDAGVGTEHNQLMRDWSTYKDVFKEPTGPSGSGSQVAQSLNAEDAANATSPFLSDDPFIASRAKQLLVGSPVEGLYYNAKGGRLIDQLRKTQAEQAALPKPKEVEPFEAPTPAEAKLQPVPNRPPEKPLPAAAKVVRPGEEGIPALESTEPPEQEVAKLATLTPDQLKSELTKRVNSKIAQIRQFNAGNLAKIITSATTLGYGLSKMVTSLHSYGPWAVGLGAAGIAGVFGWKQIGRMLDSEAVIKQLTTPTYAQLQEVARMSPELRQGVQEMMTQLANEALRSGKLKVESPWIKAFNTFLAVKAGQSATPSSQPPPLPAQPQPAQQGASQ